MASEGPISQSKLDIAGSAVPRRPIKPAVALNSSTAPFCPNNPGGLRPQFTYGIRALSPKTPEEQSGIVAAIFQTLSVESVR
jgi:hypothetical protein